MSEHLLPDLDALAAAQVQDFDRVCDRFEEAWKAGRRPRPEEYLDAVPEPARPALLRELLALEVTYRRLGGEQPETAEYRERFPGLEAEWFTGVLPAEAPAAGAVRSWGKFRLLERVGTGAFGTVWRAEDTELDRTVALKVPHPGLLDEPTCRERFAREARAAARLRHPGIATVHEVATLDGLPVIVSDFIDGVSLRDRLRAGRPGGAAAAALVAAVAEALDYAHGMGVVHRDVKPANILLSFSRGPRGRADVPEPATAALAPGERLNEMAPKIVDFGLALRDGAEATLTLEAQVLGTPAYMSPEQAAGQGHRVDRRSDVYSLGVILYELLTGELPFRGSKSLILHQVLRAEPPPPRRLNARVPRDLETIALKCLAKEPARRYATARELADDLRRFLQDEPIRARRAGRAEQLWRWSRRNPALASLSGAVVVLLIAAALGATFWAVSALEAAGREQGLRADAEAAERSAVAQVVTLHVTNGMRLVDEGDLFGALPYLVEALRRDAGDPTRAEMHRWRIGAVLQQCPKLVSLWSHDDKVVQAEFDATGRRVVTASDDGTARVWDVETGRRLAMLKHAGAVRHAAFSPDGRRVVTASADGTARIWEADTGRPLTEPLKHGAEVKYAEFNRGGDSVVTAGLDRTARIWDAATGQERRALAHALPVYRAVFSPDGRLVLTASRDLPEFPTMSEGLLWDAASGRQLGAFRRPGAAGGDDACLVAMFSPDGSRVVTVGVPRARYHGRALVWETASRQLLREMREPFNQMHQVSFNPDGSRLALGGGRNLARVWDVGTGRWVTPPMLHQRRVTSVTFSPEGGRVLTASEDGTARVWDAVRGVSLSPLLRHAGPVRWAVFHPDGRRVLTAGEDGTARLWDLAAAERLTPAFQTASVGAVSTVRFSADGRRVLTAGSASARLWDAETGEPVTPWLTGDDRTPLHQAVFSPDGQYVATSAGWHYFGAPDGRSFRARLWRADTGAPATPWLVHSREINDIAFSADGGRVVTASGRWYDRQDPDGEAAVWDVATGQRLLTLKHRGAVRCAVFSPDGRRVATACADGAARIWEAVTGRLLLAIPLGERVAFTVFSPDGHLLATAAEEGRVRVWDAVTAVPVTRFLVHRGAIRSAPVFSPDGSLLLTASKDVTAQIWGVATGTPVTPPLRHVDCVNSAAFSCDGRRVVTAGFDNSVRVWDAATGQPLTPALGHPDIMYDASFSPDGRRVVTACRDCRARVWDLPFDDRPVNDLVHLVEVLSGHRIDATGGLVSVPSTELTDAWQGLAQRYAGHFRVSAVEVAAWHRHQAEQALAQTRWAEVIRHLDPVLASPQAGSQDWYERGRARAELGRRGPAAADYARALEMRPGEAEWRSSYGLLRLAEGDLPAYRSACVALMDRYGRGEEFCLAQALGLAVMAPAGVPDPAALVPLTERGPGLPHRRGALYRAGRYDAVPQVPEPRRAYTTPIAALTDCRNRLFIAMAHSHLGHAREAQERLREAVGVIEKNVGVPAAGQGEIYTHVPWELVLSLQLLRREAEALIHGKVMESGTE